MRKIAKEKYAMKDIHALEVSREDCRIHISLVTTKRTCMQDISPDALHG